MLWCGNNLLKRVTLSHAVCIIFTKWVSVHIFYLPLNQKANDQLPAENELTWRGRGDTELRQNKQ